MVVRIKNSGGVGGEHHGFRGPGHVLVHQALEVLLVILPAFLCVLGSQDVLRLVHVHEEGETVYPNTVNFRHVFSFLKSLENRQRICDIQGFELVGKRQVFTLSVKVDHIFRVSHSVKGCGFTCTAFTSDQDQAFVVF